MIIGISGKARHGKDTLAEFFVKFGCKRISYADALKAAAREVFGFTEAQLYGEDKEKPDPFWVLTPRDVLQRMGTEAMRRTFGDDVWVRAAFRRMTAGGDWVIPDVRFPNEAEAVHKAGGIMIRINRRGVPAVNPHISETALDDWPDFDAVIQNNGTLGELEVEAQSIWLGRPSEAGAA